MLAGTLTPSAARSRSRHPKIGSSGPTLNRTEVLYVAFAVAAHPLGHCDLPSDYSVDLPWNTHHARRRSTVPQRIEFANATGTGGNLAEGTQDWPVRKGIGRLVGSADSDHWRNRSLPTIEPDRRPVNVRSAL